MLSSGVVAIQASLLPEGLVPHPTMVLPSNETASAFLRSQPVRSMPPSVRICDKDRIPCVSSQMNAVVPSSGSLPLPTTTEPSPETSRAPEGDN